MDVKPRLHGDKHSQVVRAVLALLTIGKIDYEFVHVDLATFQSRSKEFLELNPFGHIPFLEVGTFKLGESSAIMLYLCEKYPQLPKTLMGRNIEERAIVNQYLSWYQNEFRAILFEPLAMRKRYLFTGNAGQFTPSNDEYSMKRITFIMRVLEQQLQLGGKRYLCGDDLSVADLLVYYECTNLWTYEKRYPDLSHVKKWMERMEAIPEVTATNKEFMESLQAGKQWFKSVKPPQPKF